MTDSTPDQRAAARLNVGVDHIRFAREDWNQSQNGALVRETLKERLERLLSERITTLKSIIPEDLKKKQGEIAGLELALSLITNPLNNE